MKKQDIKVVIPCAGNGTRLYPHTLAVPKEMTPIGRKPILQIIIENVIKAGIKPEKIALVINQDKEMIKQYFSGDHQDVIDGLRSKGKTEIAYDVENIPRISNFIYQNGLYGNRTPLENARDFVGESDVMYIFPDDLFFLTKKEEEEYGNEIVQMLDLHKLYGGSILACKKVDSDDEYDKYGIIAGRLLAGNQSVRVVDRIDEKPGKANAKSDMSSVSMFIFENAFFEKIDDPRAKTESGENMIQPVIQLLIDDGLDVYGLIIKGRYCDSGNKLDLEKTRFLFSYYDEEINEEYRKFIKEIVYSK